ncbi:MAG: lysophospholipase L1-like esterase [Gammaproteobacteria bacterium]|jgi:lysophospholipase L1-like esterase
MLNIICFGDSITEGGHVEKQHRWTSILQSMLDEKWPDNYRVINKGIGGNTSAQGLDRFFDDVLTYMPGLLLVEFGFNDVNVKDWSIEHRVSQQEFVRNLREFHRVATANGSSCVYILNHTIAEVKGMQGNGRSYNENLAPYDRAVIELAEDLHAEIIDLPGMMMVRDIDLDAFLLEDNLHLSAAGNKHYAQMVFDVIIENNFYQSHS